MPEPRFGNCRDCAAWRLDLDKAGRRECNRRAPIASVVISAFDYPAARWPRTLPHDGCFDFIEKPAPTTDDRHV
jgi:hypothetical protein